MLMEMGQLFWGNVLVAGCGVFYLLWWVLAFRPVGAITGMKSGWLLIPAFILGFAGVILIIRGSMQAKLSRSFFSGGAVLAVAAVTYAVLLVVTSAAFHRQVTTELFLIVGWTALVFLEVNTLYGLEAFGTGAAAVLFAAAAVSAVVSMVCYVLYYDLSDKTGYVDGMIPLILATVFMVILAVLSVRKR